MIKHNQDGGISGETISFVLTILVLFGAIGFGVWAFNGRQDYKNHVDTKVAAAVQIAQKQESATMTAQFAQDAKKPLKTYQGPEAYGSLVLNYPKTWSGYVDDGGTNGSALVDGFFAPGVVPSLTNQASVFALRVQVLSQAYAQTLQNFANQQQSGKLSVSAYALPKLQQVVGVKVSGQLNGVGPTNTTTTTMVVLPLRSNTLEISTQGTQYLDDFNNNILPNFSFSP
jgi:hypothetical protein